MIFDDLDSKLRANRDRLLYSFERNEISLICVPITENRAEDFLKALGEAQRAADAVELRLDYLAEEDLPQVLNELGSRAGQIAKPLIFTFRPREQGGKRDLTLEQRQSFWRNLSPALVEHLAFVDFELDLVESFNQTEPPIPWRKVICSWHNFDETPASLTDRFERMERTPAAVIKIATQANQIGDCLPVFEILQRATPSRPVIGLGMGLPGIATRVLALAHGGLLTFGALRRGAESASGQPTAAELDSLFRAKQLSRRSMILGIIGNPVGHSRSPRIHNAALKASTLDGVYLPFEVKNVDEFVRDFLRPKTKKLDWRLRGLSVTIPHKLAIIPHLDFIDPTARVIGAVNTVVVEGDELHGYNTDCAGAIKPLAALTDLKGARVAILGAGGSARALAYGLQQQGAETTIYARDPQKATKLAAEFQAQSAALDAFDRRNEIVVNCTPIGMHGHSEGQSALPAESLEGIKLVYDLIYAPEETALLKAAREAGCRTLGGLAMLATQAAEQFRLWTGVEIPVEDMLQWASDLRSQI